MTGRHCLEPGPETGPRRETMLSRGICCGRGGGGCGGVKCTGLCQDETPRTRHDIYRRWSIPNEIKGQKH